MKLKFIIFFLIFNIKLFFFDSFLVLINLTESIFDMAGKPKRTHHFIMVDLEEWANLVYNKRRLKFVKSMFGFIKYNQIFMLENWVQHMHLIDYACIYRVNIWYMFSLLPFINRWHYDYTILSYAKYASTSWLWKKKAMSWVDLSLDPAQN